MLNLDLFKNNTKSGTIQVNTITVSPVEVNEINRIQSEDINYIVPIPKIECELGCFQEDMGEDQYMKLYLPKPLYDVYSLFTSQEDPGTVDLGFNLPTKAGYYLLVGKDSDGHESTCTLSVSEFGIEIKSENIMYPFPNPFVGTMLTMHVELIGGLGVEGAINIIGLVEENSLTVIAVQGEMSGSTITITPANINDEK